MLNFEVINELSLKVTCTGNVMYCSQRPVLLSPAKARAEKIIVLKNCCSVHRAT